MKSINCIFLIFVTIIGFGSCEEEYIPEINNEAPSIVVEGYIEAGNGAFPPYILLTRSLPFYSQFSNDLINSVFVHNAEVIVNDGNKDYKFAEICFNDLTPEQKKLFGELLNINFDSTGLNFCAYIDQSFQLKAEVGKTYTLKVDVNGEKLSASTTIPESVGLDSLWFEQPPGEPSDTLRRMLCYVSDPASAANYYRYFTSINNEPYFAGFNSVVDDKFFNGLRFKFPLPKGQSRGADFDRKTYGLYRIGDTAHVKWANIDQSHFDFWNTLEFNRSNGGPFATYTRVKTNIKGGLGIWGGSYVNYYSIKVK